MTELPASRNFAADYATDYAADNDADFENLIARRLYVDKTSFLDDLVHRTAVLQILRPRGFGKTLSMNMLSAFLEMNYQHPEDRSRPERLFKDLAVFKNKAFCDEYMGRFPVIMISLKSVQGKDFPEAMKAMMRVLGPLFKKFAFLADSKKQHPSVAAALRRRTEICCSDSCDLAEENNMSTAVRIAVSSLLFLSDMLHTEYDRKAFIIVDGYDDPLEAAAKNGYYPEMLDVIAGMLETALKTNDHLETGFVTGNLHISFQSIYSGFNNYDESDMNDRLFAEFMGFTEDETAALLKAHGMENRLQDVMEWYGGYNFAGNEILCPRSVMAFLSRALNAEQDPAVVPPQSFRANSGINDMLKIMMKSSRGNSLERLQHLLGGKTAEIALRNFTSYPDLTSDNCFDTIAKLMLNMGYLTATKDAVPSDKYRTAVRIPNKEVLKLFSEKAETIFSASNPEWLAKAMMLRGALLSGNTDQAQNIMNAMLRRFISVRDTSHEYYYHMFLSGVLSMTAEENIDVISQIEKGDGYPDIVIDNKRNKEAVILELKKSDGQKFFQLKQRAEDALNEIRTHDYDRDFKDREYRRIFSFGISFFGKECLALKMPDDSAAK